MMRTTLVLTILGASWTLLAGEAHAGEADKAACASSAQGDDCTREDGGAGTCEPDASDPNVLTCDDGSSDSAADDGSPASDGGSNKDACIDAMEGDECLREQGDAGTCVPDDSDPGVLECEDEASGSSNSSSNGSDDDKGDDNSLSCSVAPEGAPAGLFGLLMLAGLAGARRRRFCR